MLASDVHRIPVVFAAFGIAACASCTDREGRAFETPSPSPSPVVTTTAPSPPPAPPRTAAPSSSPSPKRVTASPRRTPRKITQTRTPVFEATRRGSDEGPDYHAIFVGQNFGGNGNYNVYAKCRPGNVKVIVHDDGTAGPPEQANYPFTLTISVDDSKVVYSGVVRDGQVISKTVGTRVRIVTGGINDRPFRIEYDCR